MASVVNRPGGHRWIQFKGPAGKRRTIRLGKVSKTQATDFKRRVERLLSAAAMGQPPNMETSKWVGSLSSSLHAKLAAAGLVDRRAGSRLADLFEDFYASLAVKEATLRNLQVASNNLETFFSPDQNIHTLTAVDAKRFRAWLHTNGNRTGGPLAPTTVSRRVRRAKQIFRHAVQRQWIASNPFADEAQWNEANRSRDVFVATETIDAVLKATPSAEFRALIVVARYGGLRCPSEVLPLTWDDVDWAEQMLRVNSAKTGFRTLPLFPQVQAALSDLYGQADDGGALLFPNYQITGSGLTKKLAARCKKAGVATWKKAWQNMRATRETELLDEFPEHIAASWIGNSPKVARKHYAQITKEHIARALSLGDSPSKSEAKPEARRRTQGSSRDDAW